MYSFVLQDWINVTTPAGGTVTQTESEWLDMSPFQDVVAWVDVRSVNALPAPTLFLETAPSKDDILFKPMTTLGWAMAVGSSPTVLQFLMGSADVPVAQCLRWKITGGASGIAVTFRILIAANAPGLQPEDENKMLLMMGR
jgi:hypothetical protein